MKKCLVVLLAASLSSHLWAGATFSRAHNWVDQEVLTAADLNAEFNNILNNLDPAGMDDYSLTLSQMQTTVDPYPVAVESLATDLKGEIERLRYQILQLKKSIQTTDSTYWYQDTPAQGNFEIRPSTVAVSGDLIATGNYTNITGQLNLSDTLIVVNRSGASYLGLRAATYTKLVFGNELVDRKSEFLNSDFTVTQTGYYSIEAQIQYYVNSSVDLTFWATLRILKNGSKLFSISDARVFPGSPTYPDRFVTLHIKGLYYLTAGDVLNLDSRADPDLLVGITLGDTGDHSLLIIKRVP